MEFLSYSSEQLKQHFQALSNEEKIAAYKRLLKDAKNILENSKDDIDQLKKLSKAAVAIEETTDKELLKEFNDDHPLKEVNIVVYSPEGDTEVTNYLFSVSDSSELYDLQENKEKALYQGIKSNDVELVKQLLMVLVPDICFEKLNFTHLKEVETFLSKSYEELKPKLSKDMENYLAKKLSFYRFLSNNFNLLATKSIDTKAIIGLFKAQTDVDYQIDKLLLSLIAEDLEALEKEELLSGINNMIELLKKHEKFAEIEYKVRRLKSELASGKSKYPAEVIKASIGERESEMNDIEEKYIKVSDLVSDRKKLLGEFVENLKK